MANGLEFRKVDLHVHTPASECFLDKTVTPEDIVAQALAQGLAAIAITDHNTASMVDAMKAAAEDTDLVIFPGAEITVQPGVHVLALFPNDYTGAHVTDLLAELGLGVQQRGNSEALVTRYGVQEVVEIIRSHTALPVLAHIDDMKGAWEVLEGQTRIQLWQQAPFAAVELVGDALPDDVGLDPYLRRPAFYWASDNPDPEEPTKHSHLGIGSRYSCFKLDAPVTWEGLRLCFDDPDLRIRRTMPAPTHPVIERIRVQGGFLDGLDVELRPHLNCVIGGRGTGKSALLELVRHTLNITAKTNENAKQAQSLLTRAFPNGDAQATVDLRIGETRYRVERIAGQDPVVLLGDGVEGPEVAWQPLALTPADLLPLQVYGQKEVYQISLDPEFQLRLLDNYVAEALKPLKEEEKQLLHDLRANADDILRLQEAVEAAQESLARLPAIQEEIRRMEELNFVDRVRQKERYDREKRLLEGAQGQVSTLLAAIQSFAQQHPVDAAPLADEALGGLPNGALLLSQRVLLEAMNPLVAKHLSALDAAVRAKWSEGEPARNRWTEAYTAQESIYRETLKELMAEGQAAPGRYMQLQQRSAELEERKRQVTQQQRGIEAALEQRQKWLTALEKLRRRQYEVRCEKAEALTAALKNKVRVTVHPEGQRDIYDRYLHEMFSGHRVRRDACQPIIAAKAGEPERKAQRPTKTKDGVCYLVPEIPRYLDPIDLAAAIRAEKALQDDTPSLLESRFGVESDAMRRNIASVDLRALFELELFSVPDLPVIELQVGTGLLGYRPLDQLSIGQKCTALLSIILLESDAPLLIDQPEDDLDNQFIFDQIVEALRTTKERRQFLVATHNANIPVSGDAELIMVLEANETRGCIAEGGCGSIDTERIKDYVTRILEGGSRAFRIRKEKYGRMIED